MNHYEKVGRIMSWFISKSIKILCLCVIVSIISAFVFESYTEEIMEEIFRGFEIQYEIDKDDLFKQYGILDDGIINFDNERNQLKKI